MALYFELEDFEQQYNLLTGAKVIVNDISTYDASKVSNAIDRLSTTINDPVLSTVPQCECGNLKYGYNIGASCTLCGTIVQDPFERVNALVWLMAPDPSLKFINPTYYTLINKLFSNKIDCINWLCDAKSKIKLPNTLNILYSIVETVMGGVRSYTSFVNNLENILQYLLALQGQKDRRQKVEVCLKLLQESPNLCFTKYLPMFNSRIFTKELASKNTFLSLLLGDIVSVVRSWIEKCNNIKNYAVTDVKYSRTVNSMMVYTLLKLAQLYQQYVRDYLGKKPGLFKKHIFGARSHFTFRMTMLPIVVPHRYDEIHVPMLVGLVVYRPHIINMLVNRLGYTLNEASNKIAIGIKKFDAELYQLLNTLITEAPVIPGTNIHGLPVIKQRNPSMYQSSMLKVHITKFKEDISDLTVSSSSMLVVYLGGDFDGDQFQFTPLQDELMVNEFDTLSPWYNIPEHSTPYGISSGLTIGNPAVSVISNALASKTETKPDSIYASLKKVKI